MFKQNKNNQFSLNLENKLNHEKNNFLVSKCNKKAFDLIERWPNWQSRKLIIIGQKGSGKTHLSNIWQKKSNAIFFNINDYKNKSYEKIFKNNKHFNKLLVFISNAILATSNEANKNEIQNLKKPTFRVRVNGSWFIKYEKDGFVFPHSHTGCSWCCVYYVQLGKDADIYNGGTYFHKTLPPRNINDFGSLYNNGGSVSVNQKRVN